MGRLYLNKLKFAYRYLGYRSLRVILKNLSSRLRYRAVASPYKTILIRPHEVSLWLRPDPLKFCVMGTIMDGDWDRDVKTIEETTKQQPIIAHYRDGVPWMETSLFQETYARRLAETGKVKGCSSLKELAGLYERTYDRIFQSIKEGGFQLPSSRNPKIRYIHVCIGRDGRIIYADDGNHRLAMVKALGIESIPVRVWLRHEAWQRVREQVCREGHGQWKGHPDLEDLVR